MYKKIIGLAAVGTSLLLLGAGCGAGSSTPAAQPAANTNQTGASAPSAAPAATPPSQPAATNPAPAATGSSNIDAASATALAKQVIEAVVGKGNVISTQNSNEGFLLEFQAVRKLTAADLDSFVASLQKNGFQILEKNADTTQPPLGVSGVNNSTNLSLSVFYQIGQSQVGVLVVSASQLTQQMQGGN